MLELRVLAGEYAVHRLKPDAPWPAAAADWPFVAAVRTGDELSVVAPAGSIPTADRTEAPWRIMKVAGPLDFGLTGVLSGLSAVLAAAGVPIFVVSTFDTDYLLVKATALAAARRALADAGYTTRDEAAPDGRHP
jgi:hypothetical protein